MEVTPQAIAVVKKEAGKALQTAQAIAITDKESLKAATDTLSIIKQVARAVKEKKEAITKPLNEALKNARALFAPVEQDVEEAERLIKGKMIGYQEEVDRKTREEEARIMNDRRMKAETKIDRIAEVEVAPKAVEGNTGAIQFKEVPEMVIVDESQVPDEYWAIDLVKLRAAVLGNKAQGIAPVAVPGTKVEMKKQVSSR